MFRKYSWLIYVFIIALLLPGNFFYLLAMKNRKAAMTRLIPEKEDPVNRFTAANDRHIVFFKDSGNLLTLGYVGKVKPKVDFAVFLAKRFSPVWQITWNGDDYFDYNGDMIFDLKMPRDARKNGFMFSDGGEWKPCRAVKITKGEILYNGKPYVFEDGRWRKKRKSHEKAPEIPMKKTDSFIRISAFLRDDCVFFRFFYRCRTRPDFCPSRNPVGNGRLFITDS